MKFRISLLMVAAALLFSASLSAQGAVMGVKGKLKKEATLVISVIGPNPRSFDVFIDGKPIKGNVVELLPGEYLLTIKAEGFQDYQDKVVLKDDTKYVARMIPAKQAPSSFLLKVDSIVEGATVYVNGTLAGVTPFAGLYALGNYTVEVKAPGRKAFFQTVSLSGDVTVRADLPPLNLNLSVLANVAGARILIDNRDMGAAPAIISLPPGTYSLSISAPGYEVYSDVVQVLGQDVQVSAVLKERFGSLRMGLNMSLSMGKNVRWFVDNKLQAGSLAILSPGVYLVRVEVGDLVSEAKVTVRSGVETVVSPALTLTVQ